MLKTSSTTSKSDKVSKFIDDSLTKHGFNTLTQHEKSQKIRPIGFDSTNCGNLELELSKFGKICECDIVAMPENVKLDVVCWILSWIFFFGA